MKKKIPRMKSLKSSSHITDSYMILSATSRAFNRRTVKLDAIARGINTRRTCFPVVLIGNVEIPKERRLNASLSTYGVVISPPWNAVDLRKFYFYET